MHLNSRLTQQILRVMKITTVFLFTVCLQVSARTNGQNVTLNLKDVPLEKAFTEIKKQTSYTFIYTEGILEKAKLVDLKVSNESIEKVLALLFKEQPLTYTIVDKYVVVKQKPVTVTAKEVLDGF